MKVFIIFILLFVISLAVYTTCQSTLSVEDDALVDEAYDAVTNTLGSHRIIPGLGSLLNNNNDNKSKKSATTSSSSNSKKSSSSSSSSKSSTEQAWKQYGVKKGKVPLITTVVVTASVGLLCCCFGISCISLVLCYLKCCRKKRISK
jgi:hypothetical protein